MNGSYVKLTQLVMTYDWNNEKYEYSRVFATCW